MSLFVWGKTSYPSFFSWFLWACLLEQNKNQVSQICMFFVCFFVCFPFSYHSLQSLSIQLLAEIFGSSYTDSQRLIRSLLYFNVLSCICMCFLNLHYLQLPLKDMLLVSTKVMRLSIICVISLLMIVQRLQNVHPSRESICLPLLVCSFLYR